MPLAPDYKTVLVVTYGTGGDDYRNWDAKKVTALKKLANLVEGETGEKVEYIDYRNPKDVYINAKLSRQDFSRITTPGKGVKRSTVFSVAIGLKLTWVETQVLLRSAGYAFRDNSEFDMILMYCISKKMYDVQTINELLYEYGQDTLADNYSKVNNKGFK